MSHMNIMLAMGFNKEIYDIYFLESIICIIFTWYFNSILLKFFINLEYSNFIKLCIILGFIVSAYILYFIGLEGELLSIYINYYVGSYINLPHYTLASQISYLSYSMSFGVIHSVIYVILINMM